jgi:hypothetical protein
LQIEEEIKNTNEMIKDAKDDPDMVEYLEAEFNALPKPMASQE